MNEKFLAPELYGFPYQREQKEMQTKINPDGQNGVDPPVVAEDYIPTTLTCEPIPPKLGGKGEEEVKVDVDSHQQSTGGSRLFGTFGSLPSPTDLWMNQFEGRL